MESSRSEPRSPATLPVVETYDPVREIVVITLDMGNNLDAFLIPMPEEGQ